MVREMLVAASENRFLEMNRDWHRTYGDTFKARMPGRRVTLTVEPKNVQTILALKFKDFELGVYRNRAMRPLLGNGIFSTDGARWEHSRALLRPNFTRNQITDINVYETHVAALIKQIPRDGSTVDLQDLFFRMVSIHSISHPWMLTKVKTLDSATEFLFGESVHSLHDQVPVSASNFAHDFNKSQEGLALRNRLGIFMGLYFNREWSKAVVDARHYVDRFVDKAVDYRRALESGQSGLPDAHKMDQQYVFLYELSKQTLNKTELTDQLLSILLAGRDTTASLLSITFLTMSRRPDIWSKLRKEVLSLEGRKPSFTDLKAMTYLTWVLNESKHPLAPGNNPANPVQLYASTPSSPSTSEWRTRTPLCLLAEVRMGSTRFTSARAKKSYTQYTQCIDDKRSSGQTQTSIDRSDGRNSSLGGRISRSMAARGSALGSSLRLRRRAIRLCGSCRNSRRLRVEMIDRLRRG